jgi:hypothetical protein
VTWLLVAPLVILGSQAAHTLEYWIAAPGREERQQLLAETGHDYLQQAPIAVALCLAVVVLGLAGRLLLARAGAGAGRPLALAPFFVLPLVVFWLQEHLERLFDDGVFPLGLVEEPMFLLGLVLQLPFGYLAYALARALLAAADGLGRALGGSPPERPVVPPGPALTPPVLCYLPRLSPLANCLAARGPPLVS